MGCLITVNTNSIGRWDCTITMGSLYLMFVPIIPIQKNWGYWHCELEFPLEILIFILEWKFSTKHYPNFFFFPLLTCKQKFLTILVFYSCLDYFSPCFMEGGRTLLAWQWCQWYYPTGALAMYCKCCKINFISFYMPYKWR